MNRILWFSRSAAAALGIVLLAAGVLKGIDLSSFVRQIRGYGILTGHEMLLAAAWTVTVVETVLGAALLVNYRPRLSTGVSLVLTAGFIALTGWAWFGRVTDDCGCFGVWIQRTPGAAMIEDLVLLAAAALAFVGAVRRKSLRPSAAASGIVLFSLAAAVAMPLVFGIPAGLTPGSNGAAGGTTIGTVDVAGIDADPASGTALLILMGTDCVHCQEAVPEVSMLADSAPDVAFIGITIDSAGAIAEFTEMFLPSYPIGTVEEDVFFRLLGDGGTPRYLLVRNGILLSVWDGRAPAADEIRKVLSESGAG